MNPKQSMPQGIPALTPKPSYMTVKELIKNIKKDPELQLHKKEKEKPGMYTFQCDRCGFTTQFDTKEQAIAYNSIHKPAIQDKMGRSGSGYFCQLATKLELKNGKTTQTQIRADVVEEDSDFRIVLLKSVPKMELMLASGPVYHMYGPFFGIHKDLAGTLKLANIEYEYVDNKGGNIIITP